MTGNLNYTVALRKDSASLVGGLDTPGQVVPVNHYPMPPCPVPHDLTMKDFLALPSSPLQAERRQKVYALQRSLMEDVPEAGTGPKPVNVFTPGIYMRRLTLPAGFVCVSKRHARQHVFIISKGCVSVFTEDGATLLRAPFEFVSPAGAKRVLYVHEEAVLATVHPTQCTNVEDAERELIMDETEVLA